MFDELEESINIEIEAIKKSTKKKYINVEYYKQLSVFNTNYLIYEIYVSEYISKMAEDVNIELTSVKHKIKATIISIDENQIIKIRTNEPLTEEIYRINMEFDPSFLLKNLLNCIEVTKNTNNEIVKSLLEKIPINKEIDIEQSNIEYSKLNSSQIQAIQFAEKNQITIIWGPPGTGKTFTLSKIIFRSYLRDEKVLVLSTSNVALDHILINLDKELYNDEKDDILRLGNTNNKIAYRYTKDSTEYKEKEKNVYFATLANLSIKYNELINFDLVVIDEVSMVSLPYVFIAANKSSRNLVMLGDFRQLPPISLNESNYIFKLSIFEYLNISYKIDNNIKIPYMVMLNTQYRMTKKISELISKLFYNNLLLCGTEKEYDLSLNFINVDNSSYKNTYFSISDKSYFNPISLLIIEQIIKINTIKKEILIVSPFRPQQNLLNALFRDKIDYKGKSLTVHKAQGSEADIVIFDLTTHAKTNKENFHHFFIDKITTNLVNVAMSRAKEKLYIIGSIEMITELAQYNKLWKKLLKDIKNNFLITNMNNILDNAPIFNINKIQDEKIENFTVVDIDCDKKFFHLIKNYDIPKRNYITKEGCIPNEERKKITFRDLKSNDKLPYIVFIDKIIILKEKYQFFYINLEKTSKILQRITLESFIDTTEIDRASTFTLNCEKCGDNFVLKNKSNLTVLYCNKCRNTKFIGRKEALLIKELYKIICPECGADVIPRQKKGFSNYSFFGCTNYPYCKGTLSLYNLAKNY